MVIDILHNWLRKFAQPRWREIFWQHENAAYVQEKQLEYLVRQGSKTFFGQQWGIEADEPDAYVNRIEPRGYEELFPYIEKMLQGQSDVLWPGLVTKFAKSSGTTNAKSKYIPVTRPALREMHYQGGKDMWVMYLQRKGLLNAYMGKTVGIGGSLDDGYPDGWQVGDLSAVIMNNLPIWAESRRAPAKSIAMMPNWDEKLPVMVEALQKVDVRALAGVPTWTLLLIKEMIKSNQAESIYDVWPNLEVFFHGAVAFDPYRAVFADLLGSDMQYLELYNASEGFFGIQDDPSRPNEMLLMLDYGIFYEFKSLDSDTIIGIDEVDVGVPYELIITTNGGLWRYQIGDVIEFTTLAPYRIKIGGRTKHFINAFGEELMVGNAEVAIAKACETTGARIAEYTAGPVYMSGDASKGAHEWLFEFDQAPQNIDEFMHIVDEQLKQVNTDYAAKRKSDLALTAPISQVVPRGTFEQFLRSRGEITGRNKVPRLANHRDFIEAIKKLM